MFCSLKNTELYILSDFFPNKAAINLFFVDHKSNNVQMILKLILIMHMININL